MPTIHCNEHVKSVLENPQEAVLNLPCGMYVFRYDYPLSEKAEFEHELPAQGKAWSARTILELAAADYKKIYEEPEKYGIWGHDLGDLYFEGIHVDDRTRTVWFDMGS